MGLPKYGFLKKCSTDYLYLTSDKGLNWRFLNIHTSASPFPLYAITTFLSMQEKKAISPISFIGVWTVTMLLLFPVLLITGSTTSFLSNLVYIPMIIVAGGALIALSIPLLFRQWYKEHKWTTFLLIFGTSIPLIYFWLFWKEKYLPVLRTT